MSSSHASSPSTPGAATRRHRVVLDTDLGSDVDDLMALALILGTPEIDLRAVTTVYGDTLLRARMVARIAEIAQRPIRVHAGEATPLSGRDVWWAGHEGALYEGLEAERVDGHDAVQTLVDTVAGEPGEIDVIAIGPLTNIAAAIQRDARFAGAVRHLWVMGGAFASDGGDPEPEHNFRSDAAAARIVFAAGIPTTITGLEVTRRIEIGPELLERMRASGPLGEVIDAEIRQWWAFWDTEWNVPHDPVTVLTLTRPDLFEFSSAGTVSIEEGRDRDGISTFAPGTGTTRVTVGLDVAAVAEAIVVGTEIAGRASIPAARPV